MVTVQPNSNPTSEPRPAGSFSTWVDVVRAAVRDGTAVDVPCDGCTACCTSAQFVHIAPDETDTLAHIPRALLFPAPRMPKGHVLLGYDEHGRCPMLSENGCSIHAHRPRTCRTYDCRVFAAAGLEPDGAAKVEITRRVREWRFDEPSDEDRRRERAIHAAARHLLDHPDELPAGVTPENVTQVAVLAVEQYERFLDAS